MYSLLVDLGGGISEANDGVQRVIDADAVAESPPTEIMVNRGLLFFVAGVGRVIEAKFLRSREVTFDPIAPGGVRRGSRT